MRTSRNAPTRWADLPDSTPRAPRCPQGQPADVRLGSDARSPRVLIADHHVPSRGGICLAFEQTGFAVVAHAATAEDAVARAVETRPDACVVDIDIPGGAIAVVRTIRARVPGAAILTLTTVTNEDDCVAAITAGASAYMLKTMDPARLALAVQGILADEVAMIPRSFSHGLLGQITRPADTAHPAVPERQVSCRPQDSQVVRLMRQGLSTHEIATRLSISAATVRRHVSAALRELNAPDRRSAIDLLARAGR